jgi:hypothetical protein
MLVRDVSAVSNGAHYQRRQAPRLYVSGRFAFWSSLDGKSHADSIDPAERSFADPHSRGSVRAAPSTSPVAGRLNFTSRLPPTHPVHVTQRREHCGPHFGYAQSCAFVYRQVFADHRRRTRTGVVIPPDACHNADDAVRGSAHECFDSRHFGVSETVHLGGQPASGRPSAAVSR